MYSSYSFQNSRRTQPRAPVALPVHVRWFGGEADTKLLLISQGGCFVELASVLPKNAKLHLSFDIPGKGPHTADAVVCYAADQGYRGRRDVRGVGCRFTLISAAARDAIHDLVTQVKRTYSQIQFALAINKPSSQLPAMLKEAYLPPIEEDRELRNAVQWGLKQMGS